MSESSYPRLQLDALAFTIRITRYWFETFRTNLDIFCSENTPAGDSSEFSASRYRRTVKIGLGCVNRVMWVQVNPFNQADSPIRVELKGHPYENIHYKRANAIIRTLLYKIPSDEVSTCVTRVDVALDILGSLDDLYCHKLRSKVYTTTFAQQGELVCIRLGKSSSKYYLCVYAKKWKESRYSHTTKPGCLRVEMRCKPRVPLTHVIAELDIQKRLDNILLINRKVVSNSKVLTRSERSIARRFGITPLIMSNSPNNKRQLIDRLKDYRMPLIASGFVRDRCDTIHKQLCNLAKLKVKHR